MSENHDHGGHHGPKTFTAADVTIPAGSLLRKLPIIAAVVGIAGLGATYALGSGGGDEHAHQQALYSYLIAVVFWLSIALGGLFFVLFHHATRAGWGIVVRRQAENLMSVLPLFALLAVPIVVGAHDIFHWAHEDVVASDPILAGKAAYLNTTFFAIRAVIYVAIWTALAVLLYRFSTAQDASGDPRYSRRMRWMAPLGIIGFALTATFVAFDWIMSLDPHWYSTIFGVYYFAGCAVAGFASLVIIGHTLRGRGLLTDIVNDEHFHDLGKLLFAFMVFWSYAAFSQFMLQWYGNIPEETIWYEQRLQGSWSVVTKVLAIGHFCLPFLFLMSRHVKRHRIGAIIGATWMLLVHYLDLYWLIQPVLDHHLHHEGATFSVLHITAFLGVGGLFVAVFAWRMGARYLVPVRDPRLAESLAHEVF